MKLRVREQKAPLKTELAELSHLPGILIWIELLTLVSPDCQTNKYPRKKFNEASLVLRGKLKATSLHTLYIDQKCPLRPLRVGNGFGLVKVYTFSRFIQVDPSKNTEAPETKNQPARNLTSFVILQQIVHNNGKAFITNEFFS